MWTAGDAYECYIGRWSSRVAASFLTWLDVPPGRRWLDVGCGTGALAAAVLDSADPAEVIGVDPAEAFVEHARGRGLGPRGTFTVGDARALPFPDGRFDVAVSGLVLNFVPDPDRAAAELVRVTTVGATVAAYLWDYAGGMALIHRFWVAAAEVDPAAAERDEARFALCRPEPLRALWSAAGLTDVAVEPIEVETRFRDFDDYWAPFLGGQGPAPSYTMSLTEEHRAALRERLRETLPTASDGSIPLRAVAWAVRGRTGDGARGVGEAGEG